MQPRTRVGPVGLNATGSTDGAVVAFFERTVVNSCHCGRECEGGEAAAGEEHVVADGGQGAFRECEGGEATAGVECIGADLLHSARHHSAVDIPFVKGEGLAGSGSGSGSV